MATESRSVTDGREIRTLGQLVDLHNRQHPDVEGAQPVAKDGPQNEAGKQRIEHHPVDHHRHDLHQGCTTHKHAVSRLGLAVRR